MEQVIHAYECLALESTPRYSIDSEILRKATLLRHLHGIPKTVLPPLECYGFESEWQTIEELEEYEDNFGQLLTQCLLARERIGRENHFDFSPRLLAQNLFERGGTNRDKTFFNSLMRHWLDRISYFESHLHFAYSMIKEDVFVDYARAHGRPLSNDVLVKFVLVAIDSCCVIQNRLESERKPGCVQEMISAMEQILVVIGGVILHLMTRSDRNSRNKQDRESDTELKTYVNHRIAKILLDELVHRCPMISSSLTGYTSPVTYILFKAKYKHIIYASLTRSCLRYNYHLAKMITESCQCDLNAMDRDGNTLLHIAIHDSWQEIDTRRFFALNPKIIEELKITAMDVAQILLEEGSYPHARNKQGRCPGDIPQDTKFENISPETYLIPFKDMLKNYDTSSTLKYLVAII